MPIDYGDNLLDGTGLDEMAGEDPIPFESWQERFNAGKNAVRRLSNGARSSALDPRALESYKQRVADRQASVQSQLLASAVGSPMAPEPAPAAPEPVVPAEPPAPPPVQAPPVPSGPSYDMASGRWIGPLAGLQPAPMRLPSSERMFAADRAPSPRYDIPSLNDYQPGAMAYRYPADRGNRMVGMPEPVPMESNRQVGVVPDVDMVTGYGVGAPPIEGGIVPDSMPPSPGRAYSGPMGQTPLQFLQRGQEPVPEQNILADVTGPEAVQRAITARARAKQAERDWLNESYQGRLEQERIAREQEARWRFDRENGRGAYDRLMAAQMRAAAPPEPVAPPALLAQAPPVARASQPRVAGVGAPPVPPASPAPAFAPYSYPADVDPTGGPIPAMTASAQRAMLEPLPAPGAPVPQYADFEDPTYTRLSAPGSQRVQLAPVLGAGFAQPTRAYDEDPSGKIANSIGSLYAEGGLDNSPEAIADRAAREDFINAQQAYGWGETKRGDALMAASLMPEQRRQAAREQEFAAQQAVTKRQQQVEDRDLGFQQAEKIARIQKGESTTAEMTTDQLLRFKDSLGADGRRVIDEILPLSLDKIRSPAANSTRDTRLADLYGQLDEIARGAKDITGVLTSRVPGASPAAPRARRDVNEVRARLSALLDKEDSGAVLTPEEENEARELTRELKANAR